MHAVNILFAGFSLLEYRAVRCPVLYMPHFVFFVDGDQNSF